MEDIDESLPNPHLAFFQAMGKLLREDPTAVTARMSNWLSDDSSPGLWAPFALSIRGLAYEVMDEIELARMDYVRGLRMYDILSQELGDDAVKRMTMNVKFMTVRLNALPVPSYPPAIFDHIEDGQYEAAFVDTYIPPDPTPEEEPPVETEPETPE